MIISYSAIDASAHAVTVGPVEAPTVGPAVEAPAPDLFFHCRDSSIRDPYASWPRPRFRCCRKRLDSWPVDLQESPGFLCDLFLLAPELLATEQRAEPDVPQEVHEVSGFRECPLDTGPSASDWDRERPGDEMRHATKPLFPSLRENAPH
jgi:hypothetical protein